MAVRPHKDGPRPSQPMIIDAVADSVSGPGDGQAEPSGAALEKLLVVQAAGIHRHQIMIDKEVGGRNRHPVQAHRLKAHKGQQSGHIVDQGAVHPDPAFLACLQGTGNKMIGEQLPGQCFPIHSIPLLFRHFVVFSLSCDIILVKYQHRTGPITKNYGTKKESVNL